MIRSIGPRNVGSPVGSRTFPGKYRKKNGVGVLRERKEERGLPPGPPSLSVSLPRRDLACKGTMLRRGGCRCMREERVRGRRERNRRKAEGGVKNKSPVGRGAVQDGPKLFGTTPRAEGSSSARGNQVPLECDRPERKTKQIFMPSVPPVAPPFRLSFALLLILAPPPTAAPGALLGRNIRHYLRAHGVHRGGRVHLLLLPFCSHEAGARFGGRKKDDFTLRIVHGSFWGPSHLRG